MRGLHMTRLKKLITNYEAEVLNTTIIIKALVEDLIEALEAYLQEGHDSEPPCSCSRCETARVAIKHARFKMGIKK